MELLYATLNAVKLRSKRFYIDQYGHLSTLHYKARNFMLAILDAERPLRTLFHLFFPIPWKFRVPNDTPEPAAFLADSDLCVRRLRAQQVPYLRTTRLFQFRDTPLRSLYRLYEQTCAEETFEMTYETEYFYYRQPDWRLEEIPDPKDPNPLRYAVLAALTEDMAKAFNYRLDMGLRRRDNGIQARRERARHKARDPASMLTEAAKLHERPSAWAARVPAVPELISFCRKRDSKLIPGSSFGKRNIIADSSHLMSV